MHFKFSLAKDKVDTTEPVKCQLRRGESGGALDRFFHKQIT